MQKKYAIIIWSLGRLPMPKQSNLTSVRLLCSHAEKQMKTIYYNNIIYKIRNMWLIAWCRQASIKLIILWGHNSAMKNINVCSNERQEIFMSATQLCQIVGPL